MIGSELHLKLALFSIIKNPVQVCPAVMNTGIQYDGIQLVLM